MDSNRLQPLFRRYVQQSLDCKWGAKKRLAANIGVAASLISDILNENRDVSYDVLDKIAIAQGLSLFDFMIELVKLAKDMELETKISSLR